MAVTSAESRTSRTFTLCERFRYDYSQPVTGLCQRLKVVPPWSHGAQQRRRWRLGVEGVASSSRRSFLDLFGNLTIEVDVTLVEESVEFVLEVEASIEAPSRPQVTVVDRRYLGHTQLSAPCEGTRELALGVGFSNVAALCERVHRSIAYGWGFTGIATPASEALAGGRGVCQDYAHIMLSACRTAGLPARYVSGHMVGEGGSHAWVEVLHPDPHRPSLWVAQGWDPTHNRRTHSGYLVVAVGRDYADAAPLSGTYVGQGASNTLSVTKRLDVS